MSKRFIDKAHRIVMSNITDESFGVNNLASLLGLSTSQTLRKIKAATGKPVNKFIRQIRLKEAARLIQETDLSFSEISHKVGFASASYFSKTFSKQYGITPGEFKTRKATQEDLEALTANKPATLLSSKKTMLYALGVLLILIAGYFAVNHLRASTKSLPNSIAVLPFKDLSPEDTQWFSDGMSDNILHALAQMQDVSVTSFTSSSTYRDSNKKIPQIAKELGVSYVLEGSVTLHNNKIKIIAQLIDANDTHVWSKEYNDNFDNVISIQNNVAQEVMQQLKTTLSPEEKTILKQYPTDNMEAYHLHLEGRLINQSRKLEDLQKNIEYNKKAIALDSTFVEAYAQIAAANLNIAIYGELGANHKFVKEALYYVDKALLIDVNSAKANAVKARLLLGNDWSDSKTFFKKAIVLNPNDAEARYWYADYFLKIDNPDFKQALKQISIANKLSPFSSEIATKYAWILILNKKFDEADLQLQNYGFLMLQSDRTWLSVFSMGYKDKDWQQVRDFYENLLTSDPENAAAYYVYLADGYNCGLINKPKAKEYAKRAFELNANYFRFYFEILTSNNYFKEAEQAMQSDYFKNLSNSDQIYFTWKYYYYKEDYKQALAIIDKHPTRFRYNARSLTYAQLGDREKLDSINKIYFVHGEYKYFQKAHVHAILKERDSMYYYLNKTRFSFRNFFMETNGNPEFEPYKSDARYKQLLKEFFIPIPGE